MIISYKNLVVWQKSVDLVQELYLLTSEFPKEETYGLISQMRRAAVSIPSNIAEGSRRKDLPEYLQFFRMADASSAELETQIIISKRLYPKPGYSKVDKLLEEIQKMLNVLLKRLEEKRNFLKPKTQNQKPSSQSGVAVIFAVLLVGAILSIVFTLTSIFLPQLKSAGSVKRSVSAAYAAESALEWCLYVNRIGSAAQPIMSNGATLTNGTTGGVFVPGDCLASPVRAVGTYEGVVRSFEVSF